MQNEESITSESVVPTAPLAAKNNSGVVPIGLAIFAMFFGAGNIIFPLDIGTHAGQHLLWAILGFLLFGVGAPLLGLFATSVFHGDYASFFNRLGRVPAFAIITFLMLIIGPLSAMPRTEVVTYETVKNFLAPPLNHNTLFSMLYCGVVFVLTYRETRFMNILGYVLSPIKLISFAALIILGLTHASGGIEIAQTTGAVFADSVKQGYFTMDLLAAFFFCPIAYNAIKRRAKKLGFDNSEKRLMTLTSKACLIAAFALGAVYIGFMLTAASNASELQDVPTAEIIRAISYHVLGKFGALFVAICITFACVATAMALAEVTSNYLQQQIFHKKIPKNVCLALVIIVMFIMSQLGFGGIMKIATPILIVIYPALIVLCVVNILYKLYGFQYAKIPVLISVLLSLYFNFLR